MRAYQYYIKNIEVECKLYKYRFIRLVSREWLWIVGQSWFVVQILTPLDLFIVYAYRYNLMSIYLYSDVSFNLNSDTYSVIQLNLHIKFFLRFQN